METIKASVQNIDQKHFIKLDVEGDGISIPMSEDRPNDVKSAFNKIMLRLKTGLFQIELTEIGEDLFSQVAKEYIIQLNREVQEVHGEMVRHNLTKKDAPVENCEPCLETVDH